MQHSWKEIGLVEIGIDHQIDRMEPSILSLALGAYV
jgi:hypothetical protein